LKKIFGTCFGRKKTVERKVPRATRGTTSINYVHVDLRWPRQVSTARRKNVIYAARHV